jgi:hypothetical protein
VRSPKLTALARVLAWGAGYGAALVVAYDYAALPGEQPFASWSEATKSIVVTLRGPLINLAMIGLCDLIARSLSRAPAEHRIAAERTAAALLCTAGSRAWLATRDLLVSQGHSGASGAGLLVVVLGLSLTAWFARPLLAAGVTPLLRATRIERAVGASLVGVIILLNLPLVAR